MITGILLSGGMDSAALACWKRPDVAFTVNYGQIPANGEIRAASYIARDLGIQHQVITVDCRHLGSGHLAGLPEIPVAPVPEWWPFRNQLLITIVCMQAISQGVQELLVGSVCSDSAHADGRVEFFKAIDYLTRIQEGGIRVSCPAINLTSSELINVSGISINILSWAHSCHKSSFACGNCRGCNKHREVMNELGYEPY